MTKKPTLLLDGVCKVKIKLPWHKKLYCLTIAIFQTIYYIARYGLYGAEGKLKEEREGNNEF